MCGPRPTSEDPTSRWRAVTAGVGAKKVELDDHSGAPADTRKAVSQTNNRSPTHWPRTGRLGGSPCGRCLAAGSPSLWRRRCTSKNPPINPNPTNTWTAGQMKLSARILCSTAGRLPNAAKEEEDQCNTSHGETDGKTTSRPVPERYERGHRPRIPPAPQSQKPWAAAPVPTQLIRQTGDHP